MDGVIDAVQVTHTLIHHLTYFHTHPPIQHLAYLHSHPLILNLTYIHSHPHIRNLTYFHSQHLILHLTYPLILPQVYDVMEVLTLREKFGDAVIEVRSCDSFGKDTDLGYSQVLFTPEEALRDPMQRLLMKDFLTATFAGSS